MKKNSKYMTRALKSRDPRFAKVLGKLGYDRRDMVSDDDAVPKNYQKQVENFHKQRDSFESAVDLSNDPLVAVDVDANLEPFIPEEDLTSLRAKYRDVVGRQPYHGWNEETLRQKIKEAQT